MEILYGIYNFIKLTLHWYIGRTTICDESFFYLDAPPERICGADVPMPYAANLEALAVPQVRKIIQLCKIRITYITIDL